jgi:amino acid transporter
MGPMVAAAGSFAPLSLAGVSAIMLCIAISFSQLSRVAPSAGSSYSWIRMAFGPYVGAYGGWLLLLSNFFATMATAIPAGIYTLDLFAPQRAQSPLWDAGVGALWIIASTILLYVGVRPTAIVSLAALLLELAVLGASAIAAVIAPHHLAVTSSTVNDAHAIGFSFAGFLTAMTLGVWMSDGWEVSASASEEVSDTATASGRGGITGLLVTTGILLACMFAYLHLGSTGGFAANQADAMRYVADLLGGGVWRVVIVTTVLVSTSSTLWTTVLYLSRSVYAMGRDRTLPRFLGTLDRRAEPLWALAAVGLLVTLCELATGFSPTAADALNDVLNASSVFLGLLFVFSAAAAVKTRVGTFAPLAGLITLSAVLAATVGLEAHTLQLYAAAGVALGLPFAFWRGRGAANVAGQPPGHSEPTALAPD